MAMDKTITDPDDYFRRTGNWQAEKKRLRDILRDFDLTETLKWCKPCYTCRGKNAFMIGGFRDYCALTFFKGALLKDPAGILEKPGPNTRSARLVKFRSTRDIEERAADLKRYIREAMALEAAGKKVAAPTGPTPLPEELADKFRDDPAFEQAFHGLTPGRQRGYLLFFSGAKQAAARVNRIEKYRQRILDGVGMHDCVCGLSARKPNCDGSHNAIDGDYSLVGKRAE